MSKGYVYILKNASMPGLLKIGKTTRSVQQRASELWQTGVPTPFEVVEEAFSPDCSELERIMHDAFAGQRVSASREFFAVDERKVVRALSGNLREQIANLIDEFLPDHRVVEADMLVSEWEILDKAHRLDAHPFEIASAMEMLTDDEMQVALDRWRQLVEERKSARLRGEPMPGFIIPGEAPIQ